MQLWPKCRSSAAHKRGADAACDAQKSAAARAHVKGNFLGSRSGGAKSTALMLEKTNSEGNGKGAEGGAQLPEARRVRFDDINVEECGAPGTSGNAGPTTSTWTTRSTSTWSSCTRALR